MKGIHPTNPPAMLLAAALMGPSAPAWAVRTDRRVRSASRLRFKNAQSIPPGRSTRGSARDLADGQRTAPSQGEQILCGDLHVHRRSPGMRSCSTAGIRRHWRASPADACDFARYFLRWIFCAYRSRGNSDGRDSGAKTREFSAVSAVGSNGATEDLITFTGFEWTQAGTTARHYGHRTHLSAIRTKRICRGAPYRPCRRIDPDLPISPPCTSGSRG